MKPRNNMSKKGFFVHKLCIIIGFSLIIVSILGYLQYTGRLALFGGNTTNTTITTTTTKGTTTVKTTTTEGTTTVKTTTTIATTTVKTTTTSSTTTTVSPTDHVVFSEVFYDTPGDESDEEWIELYNPTEESVDLSGLKINDNSGTYTIPDGTSIADEEYLVIARNETGFEDLYGFSPDLIFSGLTLANEEGDVLRLKNGTEEIDMVAWENYVDGWDLDADESESIQRDPSYKDTDTDNDWIISTDPDPEPGGLITSTSTTTTTSTSTTTGSTTTSTSTTTTGTTTSISTSTSTSTTTTTVSPTDHVVFSEVFYDPIGSEPAQEWIELYNPTDVTVDLTDWTIEDNTGTYTISSATEMNAGEYLIIAHNETAFYNLYGFYPSLSDFTLSLNNDGDQLTLKDGEETEVDFVAWEKGYEGAYPSWDVKANEGESIQRDPPNQDTDTSDDWINNANPDPEPGG